MELFRLFGFAIEPQRTLIDPDLFSDPLGGELSIRASLRSALDRSLKTAEGSGLMTEVALNVERAPGSGRESLVRNSVLGLAFGRAPKAAEGALELARQLSRAMDERSPECLFLLAAYREKSSEERRVALWIFPQDEAFRFSPGVGGGDTDIELLTDIFSRTSGLRKMALFAGKDIDTHFLGARVLDYQVGRADDVADFWIRHFLDASLAITPAAGTKILADALKRAAEAEVDLEENRQVQAAALAVHTMPRTHWSIEQVADEFLTGKAREVFLAGADTEAARTSIFRLDREALRRALNVRNIRLPENVWVSAPITEVGEGKLVQIVDAEQDGKTVERLRIEADVIQDRLGSRRRV